MTIPRALLVVGALANEALYVPSEQGPAQDDGLGRIDAHAGGFAPSFAGAGAGPDAAR